MSDRGTVTLKALCKDGLDARALVELVESLGEVKDGARAGSIAPCTWLVEAELDELNSEMFGKLTTALREQIKFSSPCEVSITIWLESMQDYFDVWEGIAGEELKKYEENSEEPPTERAAKWTKTEEQVNKWYSLEEFLEIPENMLVQKLPDAFQKTLAKGCSLYQQDRRMHPSASVVALEKFSAFS